MAVTPKCLIEPVYLTTTDAQYYVVNKGITIIDKFTIYNNSGSFQKATVNLIPSGGSLATTNYIIHAFSIAPNETYEFTKIEGHILNIGDSIHALADANTSLSLRVSGREVAI